MIYFTADLHFGHKNIISTKSRPFKTVEEMDETLIKNINSTCTKRDTLVILGDVAFKQSVDKTIEQLSRLTPKLVLIRGNHDPRSLKNCVEAMYDYFDITVYHRKVVLSHYPILEWDGFFRGSVHLHGHQHNYSDYNVRMRNLDVLRYDVGVDANDFMPVSIKQIFEFFNLPTDDYANSLKNISFKEPEE